MQAAIKKILFVGFFILLMMPIFNVFASFTPQSKVDFVRDIQPIFKANCEKCHGATKSSGYLRLDARQVAMKLIQPGNANNSRLVHRILGEGGEPRMPMGGDPLKPEQIELIKRWIDEGAIWPETASIKVDQHWAFVKPERPAVPATKFKAQNPIDNFVFSMLEKQGLPASPETDKATLIRRVSLDLTGLPPSPKEVDAFVADKSPNAYEKLVDRLLASPHYGERWGRWWLDAARYADTNGYEKDRARSIWPYRDWVIKAFNQNKPFDQFTIEQLAGDLLPNPTLDQRVATGFLRNSMQNEEGGVDPEQFRVEGLLDRIDATGKTFLGLTINCAQCHSHKFDPVTQREYYQFMSFINSDDEPEIEVPDEKVNKKRAEILARISDIELELKSRISRMPEDAVADWEKKNQSQLNWTPITDAEIFAAFGVKFDKLEDGSFIAKGDNATSNNYIVKAKTNVKGITGFRIELLSDPNLPRGGPGRAADGTFYFTEFIAEAAPLSNKEALQKVELAKATADLQRPDFPVSNVIDGNMKTHWYSDFGPVKRNQDRNIVVTTKLPVGYDGGTFFTFQLAEKFDESISWGKPNIGRFRLSVTTDPNPTADVVPPTLRKIMAIPRRERTAEQQSQLFSYYRTTVPEWAEANKRIDDLLKDWPYGPTTLALAKRPQPRTTKIFKRGDWQNPGDEVTAGTPAALHPFPQGAPRNRLGLAQWIVDKNNPLTARVIINRIWQQYFGQGLVTTPEDFGNRCEKPSHPELLDWLAVEFRDQGWDMKHIHKLIVTSAMYRQSSNVTPLLQDKDPYNRWLARAPRLRVEAEVVRDVALSVSGLLSNKIGGPSVYPPIPDGVLSLGYGAQLPWPTEKGEDRYRRGMYTFWKRNVPYPSAAVFDQPAGDFSCPRRVKSNTPLQALTTLNDVTYMEAAQGLALRVWKEGGATDRDKINYAYKLCTGRLPDQFVVNELSKLLEQQRASFKGKTANAVYVSAIDVNNLPDGVDLHELAPWTMVSRVLLNLDATITKE
ncbi:MAG: PSD1 domain-containing protein [Acidobacteria bacterium]|nr:PSD1 domain-containing protein [Acidobacteriota bacterium]